jgi:diguanylate cyclase (GGDEF)-like protein
MDHAALKTRFHWAHWALLILPVFFGFLEVLLILGPRTQAFLRISLQLALGLACLGVGFKRHTRLAISAYYLIGFPLIAWFLKSPEVVRALNTDMLGLFAIVSLAVIGLSTLWGAIGVVVATALMLMFLGDFSQPIQILTGTLLMLSIGAFGAFIHWLIEHLDEAYDQLQQVALVDPLTSLGNRRKLELDFTAFSERDCLLYTVWDLDGLKRVNDQHGHAAGDKYILEFVRALRLGTRGDDGLYRTGGDEFVGLHRVTAGLAPRDAKRLIERVRMGFPNVSVGWVVASSSSFDQVSHQADQILYSDKSRANRATREVNPGEENTIPVDPVLSFKSREFDRRANAASGLPVLTTPDHA